MTIDRGMDKDDMSHIHSGILLSHRKNENAICSNMDDLQIIILSKESQKEKYHMVFTYREMSIKFFGPFFDCIAYFSKAQILGKGNDCYGFLPQSLCKAHHSRLLFMTTSRDGHNYYLLFWTQK